MITKENRALADPMPLALAVLVDRIRGLPKDDRDDLYSLVKILFAAEDDEERESAFSAMLEILEQPAGRVMALEESPPSAELKKWMQYAGGRIRHYREEAGLTQEQLASKAGLPQSHISKLENARHSPSAMTLGKIAKALGIARLELDPSA